MGGEWASVEWQRRSRVLRRAGLGLLFVYTGVVGLLAAGSAFGDPTVWEALGATALWLVPMVGAGLFAWRRPAAARRPMSVATVAMVAVDVWGVLDARAWRNFEAAHGPVSGVAGVAVCAALGAYGYRRPFSGGLLVLVVSVVPLALSAVAVAGFGLASLAVLPGPGAAVALLYLAAAAVDRGHLRSRALGDPEPHRGWPTAGSGSPGLLPVPPAGRG